MSKNLYGTMPKEEPKIVNNGIVLKQVTVDIISHINRKTNASTIKKYLNARGGFDRRIWQPPLVAQLPNGEMKLFDGDHRRALWKYAYPQSTRMPAQIVQVKDDREISQLFVTINKTGRTALKANEVFVHEVHAADPNAMRTAEHLRKCNLRVGLGTKEAGSYIGNLHNPTIQIHGFKKCIDESGIQATKRAIDLLQKQWPKETQMGVELVRALAMIYRNTNAPNNHYKVFEKFLNAQANADGTLQKTSLTFKLLGGNKNHKQEQCIALGFLEKFKDWASAKAF
jgi:hypothetical protein